ncbi:MAG: hypothetical protein AAB838_03280 [Patescibacteria group bacterium]
MTLLILKNLVLVLIIAQIFISTDAKIVAQLNQPLGKEYTTDMRAFLKTTQLMKEGKNFYPAFYEGMAGLRSGNFHPDINAWRQPFIFYLWKILPIYPLWQLLLVAIIICAYLITKNILSPLILWPYLHYSLVDLTILQPEWWGMAFLVFGLCAKTYKKHYLSGLFFLLALMCRELFIIPIFFITLPKFKIYFKFYILFFIYYIFHLANIFNFQTEWFRNYSNGDWRTLHSIFAYSSWNYFFGVYRPFVILFIFTLFFSFIKRKNLFLLATFLPFFIFTVVMATFGKIDATRDYWSIYFIPLLLISAPALISPPGKT